MKTRVSLRYFVNDCRTLTDDLIQDHTFLEKKCPQYKTPKCYYFQKLPALFQIPPEAPILTISSFHQYKDLNLKVVIE